MNRRSFAAAVVAAVSLYAGQACAQPAAQQGPQRLQGVVSTVSDKQLTLTTTDGSSATVDLLPNRNVTIVEPITLDQIQPGSYVATANKTQPDGSGVSIEIRVYPPTTPRFDVNFAMDQTGTMMTNGVVATAVSSDGGRRLTVDYGKGTRQITVPNNIQVTLNTPGSLDLVKPGIKIEITTFSASADRPARQSIKIAKADLPK